MRTSKLLLCAILYCLLACFSDVRAQWTPPVDVSMPPASFNGESVPPSIGVDSKGNAIAVWVSLEAAGNVIEASRFDVNTQQWSIPQQIGQSNSESPQVAVTLDGKAIAVWRSGDALIHYNIYQNGWHTERIIDPLGPPDQNHPSVGVDALGHAVVVWQANGGGSLASVIRSATYNFMSNSITSVVDISTNHAPNLYVGQPVVAVNASGKAVAIWRYDDQGATSVPFRIQSNTYQSGVWGVQKQVATSSTQHLILPVVAISPSGKAMANWLQTNLNQTRYRVAASLWTNHWTAPLFLSSLGKVTTPLNEEKGAYIEDVAFDGQGNAISVWTLIDETMTPPKSVIQARTFQNSTWGKVTILSDPSNLSALPQIALDDLGDGYAIFITGDVITPLPPLVVQVARFVKFSNSWTAPETISTSDFNFLPNIAANAQGNFFAIWVSLEQGVGIVQASRTTILPPSPPTVTRINPNSGPESGGTEVEISGANFIEGNTQVFFGNTAALKVLFVSPTTLIATAPPGRGIVDVTVVTPFGTSPLTPADQYTFISPPPPPLPLPPNHLRGHQIKNEFATQIDRVNVITWRAPIGGLTPVAYRIYCDSSLTKLLAIVPANKELRYKEHHRKQGKTYHYFIVSVDQAGAISRPARISVTP